MKNIRNRHRYGKKLDEQNLEERRRATVCLAIEKALDKKTEIVCLVKWNLIVREFAKFYLDVLKLLSKITKAETCVSQT